jgi:putative hemolysin
MASAAACRVDAQVTRFEVGLARDPGRIAQARELRRHCLGTAAAPDPGEERFNEHCEHLVVRDVASDDIVGAYRILGPQDAGRYGGYYADRDFDLALLIVLRDRMLEVDRPCVHPRFPFENVMTHLWSALARYLIENRLDYILGSAGVSLRDGGHVAASIYRMACARFMSPDDYRVFPRRRLPLEGLSDTRKVELPPLLKGYLDLGAWVCGEPALVRSEGMAEFPILLPLARMQGRDARDFLAKAT